MTSKAMPTTGMLSVYNGQQCVGHLMRRGKCGVEAFGANDESLGIYPTQKEAMQAVYAARTAS
jgi:hypothetical protein